MCSKPKIPDPQPPVAPMQAPAALASPETAAVAAKRKTSGLAALRIGNRSEPLLQDVPK